MISCFAIRDSPLKRARMAPFQLMTGQRANNIPMELRLPIACMHDVDDDHRVPRQADGYLVTASCTSMRQNLKYLP
jgi:hypothetical protein